MTELYQEVCYNDRGMDVIKIFYDKFRSSIPTLELEDVCGYLNEVLWKTISKLWWTRARDINQFEGFIWGMVKMRLITEYRKYSGSRLSPESREQVVRFNQRKSLSVLIEKGNSWAAKFDCREMEFKVETDDLINKIKGVLKKDGKELTYNIFCKILDGYRVKDVAVAYGVTPQTIRNYLSRINYVAGSLLQEDKNEKLRYNESKRFACRNETKKVVGNKCTVFYECG